MARENLGLCIAILMVTLNIGHGAGCFSAIYSFGDSLADTGNLLIANPNSAFSIGHLPYGETFFHRATGRCSDGRLIVDFIAEASGMPLLQPYLGNGSFEGGVNFAVAGATALDAAYLNSKNLNPATPLSLGVQINWFLRYRSQFCASYQGNCEDHFNKALFLFGEIGGNDFNIQFLNKKPIEQVTAFINPVMASIDRALRTLIEKGGARKILIQNNLPIGCNAAYLTVHPQDPRDSSGCMPTFNAFAASANAQLQRTVFNLKIQYPKTLFVFADYYNAGLALIRSPQRYGIKQRFNACCGQSGTPYNFNPAAMCRSNNPGLSVCGNPSEFVSWDGIHLTEKSYKAITQMFLESFTSPHLRTLCPSIRSSRRLLSP